MPRPLLLFALLLLVASLLLPSLVPQRPDGDATAVAAFDEVVRGRFGAWAPILSALGLLDLRHAVWPNLAGVVVALWGLDALFRMLLPGPSGRPRLNAARLLFVAGLLLALVGWGWERSRGWWGELFLAPETVAPLGPDAKPAIEFVRFDIPPTPAGAGRALVMTVRLDGEIYQINATRPLRVGGWTVQPHWFGAVIRFPDAPPLFFGASGTQSTLVDGRTLTVTVDVTTLRTTVVPPRPHEVSHYAILRARYAPGAGLRLSGLTLMAAGAALGAARHLRRLPGLIPHFSKEPG